MPSVESLNSMQASRPAEVKRIDSMFNALRDGLWDGYYFAILLNILRWQLQCHNDWNVELTH